MRPLPLLVLFLLLASACRNKPQDGRTDTYTTGSVQIAVDDCLRPIVQEEVDVFEALYPLADVRPLYMSEVEAVNLLLRDSVRLAVADRRLTQEELASFHSRKFFPQEWKIAIDGVALITHPDNPDSLMTVKELCDILTGRVTRWRQLSPTSRLGDILPVFDHCNSSTVRFAQDSICRCDSLTMRAKALQSNSEVIDFVARTPEALGVIGVNWIGDRRDSTGLTFNQRVRVLAVSREQTATPDNSRKPYQAYLYDGSYPLTRDIYALLNDPRAALSWGFASFLTSDRGQRIILKSGLVPATQPVRLVTVK